jgi:hypothetical protein
MARSVIDSQPTSSSGNNLKTAKVLGLEVQRINQRGSISTVT